MKVKGLVTIYAGKDIHPPGAVFTIHDAEGENLVARGFAEAVETQSEEEEPAPEPRKRK